MDDTLRHAFVAACIEAIDTRTPLEAERLVLALELRSWPGGVDRTVPGAVEWVRRWGPDGRSPPPPECSCEQGRCVVCN